MSDFEEFLGENEGKMQLAGLLNSVNNRKRQVQQHRETAEALKRQTEALEKQNKLEKDRALLEKQRLQIERKRLEIDNAERAIRESQNKKVRELRNLIIETTLGVDAFRKSFLP